MGLPEYRTCVSSPAFWLSVMKQRPQWTVECGGGVASTPLMDVVLPCQGRSSTPRAGCTTRNTCEDTGTHRLGRAFSRT